MSFWDDVKDLGSDVLDAGTLGVYSNIKDPLVEGYQNLLGSIRELGDEEEALTIELAQMNAENIRFEGQEQIKRQTAQHKLNMGNTQGLIASSGIIADTGTAQLYLSEMDDAFNSEMDFLQKSIDKRAEIVELGGSLEGSIAGSNVKAQTLGLTASVAGIF